MSPAMNEVVRVSLSGIDQFLSTYSQQSNAFSFIYEDDLKAELYNAIKVALDAEGLLYAKSLWVVCERHETESDSVQLVHCEQAFKGNHVDIVVWDPTADENRDKDYKEKQCSLLIEVKQNCLCKDLLRRVHRDIKKIEGWHLTNGQIALALGFCTESVSVAQSLPSLQLSPLGGPLSEHLTPGTCHATIICSDGWLHLKPLSDQTSACS
jgi:hypothetical protein